MARVLGLAVLLGACSFHSTNPALIDAAEDDAPPDTKISEPDAPPNPLCPATELGLSTTCMTALPLADVTFDIVGDDFDTESDPRCDLSITSVCWVAGINIDVEQGAVVGVHGTRALVMSATASITIAGDIDTSSSIADAPVGGPASNGSQCKPTTPATVSGGGGGGGAGGSFGDKGGDGGDVADTFAANAGGGKASMAIVPTLLEGGCSGGPGANNGGTPGRGGGAIYLVSPAISIGFAGVINGSGAAGFGVPAGGRGGGGGGSGGLIAFETPSLTIDPAGQLFANGGGGGEGSGGNPGADGIDPTGPNQGGVGGGDTSNGGNGGTGASKGVTAMPGFKGGPTGATGGGGGGGGVGIIVMFHGEAPATGIVSPAITQR